MSEYIFAKDENGKWTGEHRLIVQNSLGRKLKHEEFVHHINGDKKDNRLENLQIVSPSEHSKIHSLNGSLRRRPKPQREPPKGQRTTWLKLRCPYCGRIFYRNIKQTHLMNPRKCNASFCTSRCYSRFTQVIEREGMIPRYKKAMSLNVVCEFKATKGMITELTRQKSNYCIDENGNYTLNNYHSY